MKTWNWLLIAWYFIPLLGWSSITCYIYGEDTWGWWLLIATCIWVTVVIVWSFAWSEIDRVKNENKIYEDALINKEVENEN